MNLLIFLLGKKLKSFYSVSNWKTLLGLLVMGAILLLYAIGAGYLYDQYNLKHSFAPASVIINSIKITLIVLPLTLKFFPSVAFKKNLIGANYPVSRLKIAFIDFFAISLIKAPNWLLFLFVIVFSIASKYVSTLQIYLLLYYWFAGFLLAENIINAISWRKFIYLAFTLCLLASLILFTNYPTVLPMNTAQLFVGFTTFLLVLFFTFFTFYQRTYEARSADMAGKTTVDNLTAGKFLYLKVLYSNHKFRLSILIAFCLKAAFLCLFLLKSDKYTFSEILDKVPFLLLLQTPVILFTYAYNNIWGYFRDVELNNIIAGASLKKQVNTYLSLLWPVLLIDYVIMTALFGFFGIVSFKLVVIYLVFCIYGAVIGFLSSLRKYFFVDFILSFGSFRVKTSTTYSFLLIVPAFATGFLYDMDIYLFGLLWAMLIASLVLGYYIKLFYKIHFNKLKDSFFNVKLVSA